ncbi:MAG: ABC transporter ATP-binding protein [Desulfobacteraceae bacterium]|nr:ABC transporter ATP-binding protein [Desulfobacteraceae bacterium]
MINPIFLEKVEKSFLAGVRKVKALHAVSLSVKPGEVFGFIGPNGAGKSTLINAIMGFIRPDTGEVLIHGLSPKMPESRRKIGYLPEGPRFYEKLTAAELLTFGGCASGMSKKQVMEGIDPLLEKLEILHAKNRPIGTYSKGMKQRIGLALALIHDPDTLILDEPMSGLDPIGRNLLKTIILDLKADGKTIFFSTHILNDIETMCDRIGMIHKGDLLYCGSIDGFVENASDLESRFVKLTLGEQNTKKIL